MVAIRKQGFAVQFARPLFRETNSNIKCWIKFFITKLPFDYTVIVANTVYFNELSVEQIYPGLNKHFWWVNQLWSCRWNSIRSGKLVSCAEVV